MITPTTAYRAGLAVAISAALILAWAIGALGVIGAEGDRIDLLYLGVFGIGIGGVAGAGLQPRGMARAALATAGAHGLVAAVALLAGEHRSPVTSVIEILGVNGFFAALFVGAAMLFLRAAAQPTTASELGTER